MTRGSTGAGTGLGREPIERRYALGTLGGGAYLLISNDGQHAYVLKRYEESGDLTIEQTDGTSRPVIGTFWRVLWVKPESGLLSYAATPGRSEIVGWDADALLDAAIDLDVSRNAPLAEVASPLRTRKAAVQGGLSRYEARRQGAGEHDLWGVHDRVTRSWPALIAGRKITDHGAGDARRQAAEADADWLNRNHA